MVLREHALNLYKKILTSGAKALLVEAYHNDPVLGIQRKRKCRGSESKGIPSCPEYFKMIDQCTICKCIVEEKSKSQLNKNPFKDMRTEITHCPKGFWDDKEIADYYNSH